MNKKVYGESSAQAKMARKTGLECVGVGGEDECEAGINVLKCLMERTKMKKISCAEWTILTKYLPHSKSLCRGDKCVKK